MRKLAEVAAPQDDPRNPALAELQRVLSTYKVNGRVYRTGGGGIQVLISLSQYSWPAFEDLMKALSESAGKPIRQIKFNPLSVLF